MTPTTAKRKVMILAPHADDEVLMAGGLIRRAKKELPHVVFKGYLMTDGFAEGIRKTRRNEFEKSCDILGVEPGFMGFKPTTEVPVLDYDSKNPKSVQYLCPDKKIVLTVAEKIADERPDAIILPHPEDKHPDHVVISRALDAAIYELCRTGVMLNITVLYAPVWRDLAGPNLYVGFGKEEYDVKVNALTQHDSQINEHASASGSFNNYLKMMHGRAEFSAVAGPELIFGFGSKGVDVPYAELFDAQVWKNSKDANDKPLLLRARLKPMFFLPETSLNEEIFCSKQ